MNQQRRQKAKARAKSRAKSTGEAVVDLGKVKLNDNPRRDYWKDQSANEIRNQLRLRKVHEDEWKFKDKQQLVGIIVEAVKASKK